MTEGSTARLTRTAWVMVALLVPVALLNYLDRQMLATMKTSMVADIAGLQNARGNVLGLMPHPDRAFEEELGSADGATLFRSIFAAA